MRRVVDKLLFAAPILAVFQLAGCSGQQAQSYDAVTWPLFERVLTSENTETISQLYSDIAAELKPGRKKDAYLDLEARVDGYIPMKKWLRDEYMQAPNENRTREEALTLLAKDVSWKSGQKNPRVITKAYLENTYHPTMAETMLHWGTPVYFTVFTDDESKIVCWRKVE
ncbi:MAG: hypothetical protein MPJ50_14695 [Pirellulales bacterium]|nr:hypothetical protein [Pirellulales bacterium]